MAISEEFTLEHHISGCVLDRDHDGGCEPAGPVWHLDRDESLVFGSHGFGYFPAELFRGACGDGVYESAVDGLFALARRALLAEAVLVEADGQ